MADVIRLFDQLQVCGNHIINFDDLDTMQKIIKRWNTETYEAILERDKYERAG